jgi:hypothetical protein
MQTGCLMRAVPYITLTASLLARLGDRQHNALAAIAGCYTAC